MRLKHGRKTAYVGVALTACLTMLTQSAFAADISELALDQLLNMEISSSSKFPQKLALAPASATVVTADEIAANGHRTLADILRSLRGLYVTNDNNYSYLGVRGFSPSGDYNARVLLLLDGHRLNDSVYDQAYIGMEGIIDVALIERVEFVPGPAASVYGNNAFFGVINIVTKSAERLDGMRLSAAAGDLATGQGRMSWGHVLDNGMKLLLSAQDYSSKGEDLHYAEFDEINNGYAVNVDGERKKSFYAKLENDRWLLTAAASERKKFMPTASYGADFNSSDNYTDDQLSLLDLRYHRAWNDKLDFSARVYHDTMSYDGSYLYYTDPTLNTASFDGARGRRAGGEVQWVSSYFELHKMVMGAEYIVDYRQDQFAYYLPDTMSLDDSRRNDKQALYFQDEYALRPDLFFHYGLRLDNDRAGDLNLHPRLGLIQQRGAGGSVKLLYGTAFRTPNSYERFYQDGGNTAKVNPDLEQESIETYELVAEQMVTGNNRLLGTLYYYKVHDQITLITDPADGLMMFQNQSLVNGHGAELEWEHLWENGARLKLGYSWQRVRESAGTPRNSPRHLAKLNASAPMPWWSLRAGLEGQYVARRASKIGEVSDYVLTNARLSQALNKNIEWSLGLYNLFDQAYEDPAGDEFAQNSLRQPGRHFLLQLDYRF